VFCKIIFSIKLDLIEATCYIINLWSEFDDPALLFRVEGEGLQVHDGGLLAQLGLLRNIGWQVMGAILSQLTNKA
jgi:hypothetical protein